jgi:putative holliday junction resolvase
MKYLGIDYGTKKIGVALSDDGGSIAFPHAVVPAGRDALSAIAAIVTENGVGEVVVGESRNFAGEKNKVMAEIDLFAKELAELTGLKVHYEREFFTSAMAARQLNPSHEQLDASAAALILQSFLDRMKK